MPVLNHSESILDVKYGNDPRLDALLLHFMTENNLEYSIDPDKNATPEQVRFMVALKEDEFYAPCSDWMFFQLLKEGLPNELLQEYLFQWKSFISLARNYCPDNYVRKRFIQLARHKFRMTLASPILMPSRLMKRMNTIFMTQSGVDDPYREMRKELNRQAKAIVESPLFDAVINACSDEAMACRRIDDLRYKLDMLEVERLMRLSTISDYWSPDGFTQKALSECGLEAEVRSGSGEFREVAMSLASTENKPLRILMLPNRSGGLVFDLRLIRTLLRLGHRVVLALKEGFYFDSPTFWDVESDTVLSELLKDAFFVSNDRMSKNELLAVMRENPFIVISEGTRERFNPYRCSVTFARAWKECDLVLAKGEGKHRRLIQTSHEYTRDLINYFRDADGEFRLFFRPKAQWVRKFREDYIAAKADEIIAEMRDANKAGHTVMFYSGIVGSVPGQVDVAIEVMTTYVTYLRNQLDQTYIINPAEHFEEGMDADDLMFMWEKVQRSGFINVWRFQSHSDIEKSFELMEKKVPPVWAGKDATYSTGCTKEMHIALDVQRAHPELQIIGPSPDKFFRRKEYGVGRFSDATID